MDFTNGEILITPKLIYWIKMPPIIGELEKIELLKKDIFLISFSGDINQLPNLSDTVTKYSAYFYNIDEIIKENNIKNDEIIGFIKNFATFVNNFYPEKSIIHTSLILNDISIIFRSHGINYVEKNLSDKKTALTLISNMINPLFIEQQKIERSSIRLNLEPMKYKIEISNLSNKKVQFIYGALKDISLTGLCFKLYIQNDLNFFKIKDKLQLKIFLQRHILKINLAVISRLDTSKYEIGVTLNLSDTIMISHENSTILTSLIYNWLKSIIEKFGKITVNA